MNELVDYKKEVMEIRDELAVILKNNAEAADLKVFQDQTNEIFSKKNPSIMFYGLYNAGKSSIINAIFGKEIAKTGDVPTTCQTQRIPWKNFMIVDTPGINAKNEHTLVADYEISLHDIILFVIDDMNVEEKSFYSAFVKVLKSGKPVLIVINEKNEEEDESKDLVKIAKLRERMISNIRMEGNHQGVADIEQRENFYGIIPVNAITAFYAKQLSGKDAEQLYQASKIENLIVLMQNVLKQSAGIKTLMPAITIIENKIQDIQVKLKSTITSDSLKNYLESVEKIKKQQNSLYQTLIGEGKQEIMLYGDYLSQSIRDNEKTSPYDIQLKLRNILKHGFEDTNIILSQQYDLYVTKNNFRLQVNKDDFMIKLPETVQTGSEKCTIDDVLSAIKDTPISNDLLAVTGDYGTKKPGNGLTIAAGAGLVTGLVDPIISIPVLIYSLFRKKKKIEEQQHQIEEQQKLIDENNRMVEKRVNEMIDQIVEVNRQIRTELYKLENSYTECVNKLIEDSFQPIYKSLENSFGRCEFEKENAENVLSKLHDISGILTKVKCEIQDIKLA